jgi:hypothetical protein
VKVPTVEEILAVEKEGVPVSTADWKPIGPGPSFFGEWLCEFGCPRLQWICSPLGGFTEEPPAGDLRDVFVAQERRAFASHIRDEIVSHIAQHCGAA